MNQPKIREYSLSDKERCLQIFDSNIPEYFMDYERTEFIEWLDKIDREPYFVLTDENELVACGGIYKDEEQQAVGLAWGMVDNKLHRQGYGKLLTEYRVRKMNEHYPQLMQRLLTSQHTFGFYEKLGFQTVEVIKDGFGEGMDSYKMVANRKLI